MKQPFWISGGALLLSGLVASSLMGNADADWRSPSFQAGMTAQVSYVQAIPGTPLRFAMRAIPGGTYQRGSPTIEKGRGDDEGPQHPVTVRPFWMGRCEVTWDEFNEYRKRAGPRKTVDRRPLAEQLADAVSRPTAPYIDETFGYGSAGYPAIGMTHHAAMEYCRWLSVRTGHRYRLPTEAEWEWACRAGTRTAYSFGDDPARLTEFGWFAGNASDMTHPVGLKKPNAWGLHDLHGNVAEWCLDHYDPAAYGALPSTRASQSPVRRPTADWFPHVARGGFWGSKASACRSAARWCSDRVWQKSDPERPQSIWWLCDADFIGFRVVRPVEEQADLKGLVSTVTRPSR